MKYYWEQYEFRTKERDEARAQRDRLYKLAQAEYTQEELIDVNLSQAEMLEDLRAELQEVQTCLSCNISTLSSSGAKAYEEAMAPVFAELAAQKERAEKAECEVKRLGEEVEELMHVDYWQDRHNIVVKERDIARAEVERLEKQVRLGVDLSEARNADLAAMKKRTEKAEATLAEARSIFAEHIQFAPNSIKLLAEYDAEIERILANAKPKG